MKNTRPLIAGAAALTLTLSACGGSGDADAAEESGAAGAESGTVTVEHMYGPTEVEIPEGGELRVVALGWSDAEVSLALGVEPIAVHDWLGFGEENHGVGPWAADLVEGDPEVIPRSDEELDYEQIQALDPDLILNVNSGYEEDEYDRLSEIAPTVSGPEGAENFNPGWENHTQLIADALGLTEEGEQLIADTEDSLAAAREEHPELDGVEAVTGSKFGEAYGLSYTGDMRWDIMEELGFQMYGPAADMEPNQGFFADVSEEQVEVLDAEVAVLFPIGYTLEELEADPLLSSLDVVQDERAVLLDNQDDLVQAFSAGSPLSIELVLEELPEQLAEAVENLD
ncbi:iron-siderophore ABC transporter substrate-binding protein [Nesterenkonia populi]